MRTTFGMGFGGGESGEGFGFTNDTVHEVVSEGVKEKRVFDVSS